MLCCDHSPHQVQEERRPVVPFTDAPPVLQIIPLNRMYTHHSGPPLDKAVVDRFAKAIAQSGGRLDPRFPLAAIQLSDDARRLLNTGDKEYFVLNGEHRVKAGEQKNVGSAYVNVTSFVGGFATQARIGVATTTPFSAPTHSLWLTTWETTGALMLSKLKLCVTILRSRVQTFRR